MRTRSSPGNTWCSAFNFHLFLANTRGRFSEENLQIGMHLTNELSVVPRPRQRVIVRWFWRAGNVDSKRGQFYTTQYKTLHYSFPAWKRLISIADSLTRRLDLGAYSSSTAACSTGMGNIFSPDAKNQR